MWKIFLLFILVSNLCFAQFKLEDVVVSSQSNTNSQYITSSHIIIDENDIQKEKQILDVLKNAPGIYINQSGGPGSLSSIHIRGSESRHVLILIDGVRIYDPSSTDRISEISNLNVFDIEKIEVLKGSQGQLYGSDAIAGVINIITKKNIAKNKKSLSLSTGAINHFGFGYSTLLSSNNTISIYSDYNQSKLISAAKNGNEKDGYVSKNATINWTSFLTSKTNSILLYKINDSQADTDAGAFLDDKESSINRKQQLLSWKLNYEGDNFQFENIVALNKHERKYMSSYGNFPFEGENFSIQSTLNLDSDLHKYLIGMRNDFETINSLDTDVRTVGILGFYGQYQFVRNNFFTNIGTRADFHEQFGEVFSYSFGLGNKLNNYWILKSNFSTGFKSPSLYQLYAKDLGNPINCKVGNINLQPELSKNFEVSALSDNINISLFSSNINNFINYECNSGYENIESFKTLGIEVIYNSKINNDLNLNTSLLLADYQRDSDLEVARRPNLETKVSLNFDASDKLSLQINQSMFSSRFDYIGTKKYVLSPYYLTNLYMAYKFKNTKFELELNNLFNEKYEQAIGFNTLGLNGLIKFNYAN